MSSNPNDCKDVLLTIVEKECILLCAKKYFEVQDSTTFSICEYNLRMPNELLGYLGEHKYGTVKIQHNDQCKIMPIFIKSMPENTQEADEIKSLKFFDRECCVYANIFPYFKKREDDDRFIANILHVRSNEQLFFEDMSVKGFRITSPRESLDDDHCMLTLKQIAKMHADSLIFEEKRTRELNSTYRIQDEYKGILNEQGFVYEGWYYIGAVAGLETAKISKNMPKNVNIESFSKKWHEFFKNTLDMCKPSEKSRNVLSHGDLWSNNIMYRYDDDGKPVQSIIVDFQKCGCIVPAADVMSFIYLNIGDDRRRANLEKYLKHYYQSLKWELGELKVENLVPWNEFRESCEEYKAYALMQCIILLQLGLIDGKHAKDIFQDSEQCYHYMRVSRTDLILDLVKNDHIFRELFMFSIDEVIQRCI